MPRLPCAEGQPQGCHDLVHLLFVPPQDGLIQTPYVFQDQLHEQGLLPLSLVGLHDLLGLHADAVVAPEGLQEDFLPDADLLAVDVGEVLDPEAPAVHGAAEDHVALVGGEVEVRVVRILQA